MFDARSGRATLLLICAFTFFLGLGRQAITDSDEAYYAEASREMVERGDWLTPHFNDENRWQKPVLYYWLTSATYLVIGPTELAARFWSALSGVGLTLLAWALTLRVTQRADAAWLGGAIVATCFGYFAMARAALPDLPLTFCITLGIWAALEAVDAARTPAARAWWALAGLSAALGFLVKGPVALAVPAIVLLPIAWRERRHIRIEAGGIALAAVVFALVGLPWYLAMWSTHGDAYLESFFVGDNLERFATERFNDARPFWFYLPVLVGGMLPWSVYLIAMSASAVSKAFTRTLRLDEAQWRLVLWALMPLLFYTLSVGKQPRYILPVLPPVAALLAKALTERIDDAVPRSRLLTISTSITAALYVVFAVLFVRMKPVLINTYDAATWAGIVIVGCAAIALVWVAVAGAWRRLPIVATMAAALLLLSVQFGVLAGRRPEAVEEMATLIRAHRTANEPIGVFDLFSRNIGFYTGTARAEVFGPDQAAAFLRSPQRVLLVVRARDISSVEAVAEMPVVRLGQVEYLNTANVRLRTLFRPDPREEIETVSLVSNR